MKSELRTERLCINDLKLSDAAFMLELTNTPGWLQFIGNRNIHSIADAEDYIRRLLNNPEVDYHVVRQNENGSTIGVITLIQRYYLEHKDLGFAFLPQYGGKGYAREAALAVLTQYLNTAKEVAAITMPENVSSIRLLEQLGFTFQQEVIDNEESLLLYRFISPH